MDLADLYQDIILDHGKNPRNHREMPDATHSAEGYNPICGDQITVWLRVDGDVVADASFTGHGCAISQASASMMTQAIKGQRLAKVEELFGLFREVVTDAGDSEGCDHSQEPTLDFVLGDERLGELSCLSGVRRYPNRIKCATLAWHAMHSALEHESVVSTE